MIRTLLDGPGCVLELVHPRFLVDLAQGDDVRNPQAHQQQFRERLMQALFARMPLKVLAKAEMINAPLSQRLALVERLTAVLDPGHLALTQIAQYLTLLQKMDFRPQPAFPELPQQIVALYEWFSARCRWKEKALTQRGLLVQAGEQSEQIFTRWRAGAYNAWSLPGRCFIVLEELRWGAFGDACRLGSPQAVALLLGDLRVKATQHLAESINAAPTTRHYYHQWFASSTVSTGGDHADFLSWLGKWSTADKQPVCWSVTQRWRTVALGMPRLCSAQRLAGAMVEEIFSVNLV
ncbi:YjcZ-like family protein [Escherichia coli]